MDVAKLYADVLCQSFTGLSGGVCPGGSATFTCVADATTITWIVTSGGTDDTCVYSQAIQTDSCEPGNRFMSSQTENGGPESSSLIVTPVNNNLNGTSVTCLDGSTFVGNSTICIIGKCSDHMLILPLFQMCCSPLNFSLPVSVD